MLLNTFRSELTKLFTTRSVWWTTGVFFFLSIGWTLLMTLSTNSQPPEQQLPLPPNALLTGVYSLAMPVLLIQAVMVVTTEYRFGVQTNTYMATQNRAMVATVKAIMYAVIAAVLVVLGILATLVVAKVALDGQMGENFEIFDDFTKRAVGLPAGHAAAGDLQPGVGPDYAADHRCSGDFVDFVLGHRQHGDHDSEDW